MHIVIILLILLLLFGGGYGWHQYGYAGGPYIGGLGLIVLLLVLYLILGRG